ncbi:MAG: hypothetical protein H6R17_4107 [Proteobacteria bacterium]|nr:hypothetical protein [Pseudomonadota bacterium]
MISRRFTLLVAPRDNFGFSACGRACPRCSSALFRVAPRLADLLLGLFIPLHRYRCISLQCSWEGNLREQRHAFLPQVIGGKTKCPVSSTKSF